ncbi:MAG: sugar phosphate isomerase/epimerase [Candidatus Lokiarchaeota archaeon]|nr:sugar phosphate isomerase/epimerase [Candidatus Lokiarchaeota archaeon]
MELGISSLGSIIDCSLDSNCSDIPNRIYHATEECLKYAEENAINLVELVVDPQDLYTEANKQDFIDLVNSYSLKKQVHGPFIDINLCSHNNLISQASVEAYIEAAGLCKRINADLMTIHPGLANFMLESMRDYNKIQLSKALKKLLNYTGDLNLFIGLENMPKNTHIMLDQVNIEEILNSIGRTDLFLTYDTSHFYTNNGDVNLLWKQFHKIIKNVHLVENFTTESDTHPPLGSGKVDFKGILETIRNYRYKGALIIELSSNEDLDNSFDYIYKLL